MIKDLARVGLGFLVLFGGIALCDGLGWLLYVVTTKIWGSYGRFDHLMSTIMGMLALVAIAVILFVCYGIGCWIWSEKESPPTHSHYYE